ncbi:MAG: aminoacetone oxidase family FAD-binding enzyme [Acidobacteria bacterium]|nr:aminoacetone oxidase family FAD-binding enzyme [Acidobacteriota bacterium]
MTNSSNDPSATGARVVVIGAGAAGLVAAAFASTPEHPAILVERTTDGGRKILISGGGRCNVLPAALEPDRFITSSPPHLLRHMLRAWPLEAQKAFFENELGVPLKFEGEDRKYFPVSDRARDVRDALVNFAIRRGVDFRFDTSVKNIVRTADGWRVETMRGDIEATKVIIATGGLSVTATGSDGTGLRIAEALGHTLCPTYPALTPLLTEPPVHAGLAGVSLHVRIRAKWKNKVREAEGGFLFTHRGYSGPAVLDISDVVTRTGARVLGAQVLGAGAQVPDAAGAQPPGAPVLRVQWGELDASAWEPLLTKGVGFVSSIMGSALPQRLVDQLMVEANVPHDRRVSDLRRSERIALLEKLTSYVLPWSSDEGYKKAEVTGGGVALDEVDLKTLESRKAPGIYFCGEVLDAFGPIGGHNFAWAWATGRAAGIGAGAALGQRAEGKGQK